MLNRFYEEIEAILKAQTVLLTQLRQMRDLVADCLTSETFRLDCAEALIACLKQYHQQQKTWDEPTLFYHEELKFSFRLISWPAFYENNPHEHKTWSVTGIIHNQLDISIFTLIKEANQLKKDRALSALAGEAGYLIPGCIHKICNPSHELSASIHIFSNLDITKPENNAIWYPRPRKFNLSKGLTERALQICIAIASECKSTRALQLLKEIYRLSPPFIKYLTIQAIYTLDNLCAEECYEKFKETLLTSIHQHNAL